MKMRLHKNYAPTVFNYTIIITNDKVNWIF